MNVYDYGWRDYDPSIGRFNKMDRYSEKYMERSPYNYAANNPVYYIDVAGDSLFVSHGKMTLRYENGKFYNKDNSEHTGKLKGFFKKAANALGQISNSKEGAVMLSELESSNNSFTIEKSFKSEFVADDSKKAHGNQFATDPAAASSFNMLTQAGVNFSGGSGGKIFWDPSGSPLKTTAGLTTNSMTDLAHEMFHGLDSNRGLLDSRLDSGVKRSEWQAVYRENILRAELTLPVRTYYQSTLDASGNNIPYGPRMLTPANQPIQPAGYKH